MNKTSSKWKWLSLELMMTWLKFISKNCRKLGLKILTFKLSDFYLDDVLFIEILVKKHTFKKINLPKKSKNKIQKNFRKFPSPEKSFLKML